MPRPLPVLLITFNRPDLAAITAQRIAEYGPSAVFLASDGPRDERERDVVNETRSAVLSVLGEVAVSTLFREDNLGCKRGVEEAVSWFFDAVDEGIVLEDDCVPGASFFEFCGQMLERYRHDERIMHVGGYHLGPERAGSYVYSQYPTVWGWASWRRAWSLYRPRPDVERTAISPAFGSHEQARFMIGKAQEIAAGNLDAWGFLWSYALITNRGLSVQPLMNLVANVGVGDPRAAHTVRPRPEVDSNAAGSFSGLWSGPPTVFPDFEHDREYFRTLMTSRKGRAAMWLPPRVRTAIGRLPIP